MKAEKYLESIGLENVIDEEFFNDDDKSWYKVQELMEAYHQEQLKLLNIDNVMPCSLTAENGAKGLLIGEFFYENEYEDEDGEYHTQKIPLEWTTIKDIYKKIVEHYKA